MPTNTLGPADAALVAAEQEINELWRKQYTLRTSGDKADHPEISQRAFALDAYVAKLAPDSLIGAAVKLRRLADQDIGIDAGLGEGDVESVQQILAIVERSIAPGKGTCDIEALRERVAAIIAEFAVPLPEGDAALDEAVGRMDEMAARWRALSREFEITLEIERDEIIELRDQLDSRFHDLMIETEPQTLAGAVTLLRYLADDSRGLVVSPGDELVENVLALVERMAAKGGAA